MSSATHRSPERDPVLLAIRAACAVLLVVLVVLLIQWGRPIVAVATKHCPAPDHAVWAPTISQAICGDSFTGGVKSR